MLTPNSVKVTWNLSADVSDYLISCTTTASYAGGRNVIVNGGDKTSYTFNNLVKNTPYVITVQGLTKDGRKSICSNEVLLKTSTIGRWHMFNWVSIIKSSNMHMRLAMKFVSCLLVINVFHS